MPLLVVLLRFNAWLVDLSDNLSSSYKCAFWCKTWKEFLRQGIPYLSGDGVRHNENRRSLPIFELFGVSLEYVFNISPWITIFRGDWETVQDLRGNLIMTHGLASVQKRSSTSSFHYEGHNDTSRNSMFTMRSSLVVFYAFGSVSIVDCDHLRSYNACVCWYH